VSRRYPVRNAKEVIEVLRMNGFLLASQAGSHQKWRHANGRQVIVAMHGNKPIPIGTSKALLTEVDWRSSSSVEPASSVEDLDAFAPANNHANRSCARSITKEP
jgi:predicted RNA binding protein YcfA (HicA-like mRNA interferase family)